jgi:menaquinone-dependent protoporphyrinogen IX oxidase
MTRTLVVYASKHGSTEEVARWIGSYLRDIGHDVDVRDAALVPDVEPYDVVIAGGSLYMGRWHADARAFLRRHRAALEERGLAVFALGPLTLEDDKVAGSRQQLEHALRQLGVYPQFVTIFGGVVDPKKLHFPFNHMPPTDARNSSDIAAWAREVALRCSDHAAAEPV